MLTVWPLGFEGLANRTIGVEVRRLNLESLNGSSILKVVTNNEGLLGVRKKSQISKCAACEKRRAKPTIETNEYKKCLSNRSHTVESKKEMVRIYFQANCTLKSAVPVFVISNELSDFETLILN